MAEVTQEDRAGEIVAYLQATAPNLARALTRERLDLLGQIDRNRRLLEAGERLDQAIRSYLSAQTQILAWDKLIAALAAYQEAAKP